MRTVLIIFICTALLWANDNVASYRSSGFEFLNHTYGAKSIGLGGVHSLLSKDRNNLINNATSIATLRGMHVTGFYQPYLMSTSVGGIGYAFSLPSNVVMSIDLRYKNSGEIIAYNELGEKTGGSFNPYALAFATSAAYNFDGVLSVSGSMKIAYDYLSGTYVDNGISYKVVSAGALLFDAGMLYDKKKYAFSSGIRNVGPILNDYSETTNSVTPASFYTGAKASLKSEVTTNWYLESEYYFVGFLKFKAALEVPLPKEYVTLRAGTSFTIEDVKNIFETVSGDKPKNSDYSKQDIQLFSFGGTLRIPIQGKEATVDAAATINTDKVYPLIAVSLGYGF